MLFLLVPAAARAQDNDDVQLYGAETIPPSSTMIGLHSNVTFRDLLRVASAKFPLQIVLLTGVM
jgi:hypothetical protein